MVEEVRAGDHRLWVLLLTLQPECWTGLRMIDPRECIDQPKTEVPSDSFLPHPFLLSLTTSPQGPQE